MFYRFVLQNFALPLVSRLTESEFWSIYRGFVGKPAETIFCNHPGVVFDRIKVLLAHAYGNVPFYRERMQSIGLTPSDLGSIQDFSQFPITTKADINANFPDRMVDASGSFQPWRYRSTSATIDRLTVIHDFRKRDFERAAGMFALRSATGFGPGLKFLDIPPDVCRHTCGSANTEEPRVLQFIVDNLIARQIFEPEILSDLRGLVYRQLLERRTTLPSFGDGGATQSEFVKRNYLNRIAQRRPYVVKALPVYLYALATHLLESGDAPPHIKAGLMPMGGSVSDCMKERIESAFGRPVHEDYGTSEMGSIAAECGARSGLHPFSGLFHVEVVRDGRPAKPGEVGKVLITDLYNFAMPFIRYEVGDLAKVVDGPCRCGLTSHRILVQGRSQDAIFQDTGEWITSDVITDRLLRLPGVFLFQLDVLPGNEVDVQIAPFAGASPNLNLARETVAQMCPAGARISCRLVSTILPEPNGKYRLVRNAALAPAGCL